MRDRGLETPARWPKWLLLSVLLLLHFPQAHSHSWIDCLDTDRGRLYDQSAEYIYGGAKGNGFCRGYGAGFPGRGVADIGPLYTHKMLKNEVESGTSVCQSVEGNTYQGWRKRLAAAAGTPIYFAYLENGHISKDKMGRGTQHGVYWTGEPETRLQSTLEMTPARLVDGRLRDFDDGNCGETTDADGRPSGRAGDGKPCIGEFTIPKGSRPGIYHFVWYWKFYHDNADAYVDKARAKGYFGAAYSTCFDVEVLPSSEAATGGGGGGLKGGNGDKPMTPTVTPKPTAKPTISPKVEPTPTPKGTQTSPPSPTPTTGRPPAPTPAPSKPSAAGGKLDFNSFSSTQLHDAVAGAKDPQSTVKPKRHKKKHKECKSA